MKLATLGWATFTIFGLLTFAFGVGWILGQATGIAAAGLLLCYIGAGLDLDDRRKQ